MIYLNELKKHFKSALILAIVLSLCSILFLLDTKEYSKELDETIKTLPKLLQLILGFGSFDASTLRGNYMNTYSYILLAIFAYTIFISTDITAKHHTIAIEDISPVSKHRVMIYKLLAILTISILLFIVCSSVGCFVLLGKNEKDLYFVILIFLHFLPTIFLLICIGMLIGHLPMHFSLSASISLFLIVGFYVCYLLANIYGKGFLLYSPLSACINTSILAHETNVIYIAISFLLGAVLFVVDVYLD